MRASLAAKRAMGLSVFLHMLLQHVELITQLIHFQTFQRASSMLRNQVRPATEKTELTG
jgi:hypothetical protein